MKKKILITAAVTAALVLVWCVLLGIDYNAVLNLRDPVIARHAGVEGGTFRGIGWTVELEKHNDPEFGWVTDSAEIYLFGKLVGAAVT